MSIVIGSPILGPVVEDQRDMDSVYGSYMAMIICSSLFGCMLAEMAQLQEAKNDVVWNFP